MPAPYEKTLEVIATSGQANHFSIPFLPRGRITKILVKQIGGVDVGFMFDLYNSKQPSQDFSQSSQDGQEVPPNYDPLMYQIIPTQNKSSGSLQIFNEQGDGFEFRNQDGSYSVPQRFVYARLQPNGSGNKTYQITLTGVPPV